jgi:hypothetical protein
LLCSNAGTDLILLPLTQRVYEGLLKLKVSATNLYSHPYFSNRIAFMRLETQRASRFFPYAFLDYRLQTRRHVFVPGRAGQEISVFAGRQFVNRHPYPQCDTVSRVVIHPEAVR